jgi:uncharacterized delta-60 repeat protein
MALRILQATTVALAFVATAASAHDGDLDRSFGTDGLTVIDFGAAATAYGLAIDSNSRVILGGTFEDAVSGTDFAAARLTRDGLPDASFSFDGWTTIAVGSGAAYDGALNTIVQSDNKIVLVGEGADTDVFGDDSDFKLVRLNVDGTLDTTFSGDGKAYVNFDLGGMNSDRALDAVQLPNGKLIVVGVADVDTDNSDFAITRLNVDGTRDTGFSGDGRATVAFDLNPTDADDIASSVAIDAEGNIVVAGTAKKTPGSDFDFAIARLTPNGALDPNFGGDGRVTVAFDQGGDLDDEALELIIAPDGSIFVTGASTDNGYDFAAVKLQPDGTPDPTFGNGGKVTIPFDFGSTNHDISYGAALQPDGKLVLAGLVTISDNDSDIALVRLNTDGTLDDTFGFGGKSIISPNLGGSSLTDGAVRARIQDGYLVFGGIVTAPSDNSSFAAGRIVIDTIFDNGFEQP